MSRPQGPLIILFFCLTVSLLYFIYIQKDNEAGNSTLQEEVSAIGTLQFTSTCLKYIFCTVTSLFGITNLCLIVFHNDIIMNLEPP